MMGTELVISGYWSFSYDCLMRGASWKQSTNLIEKLKAGNFLDSNISFKSVEDVNINADNYQKH